MPDGLFQFGESHPDYSVRVMNERAVRAGAGILFVFAFIAFMNAWLMGNFQPTRIFVVVFLADFCLRLFVNPALAPSLILGQWVVRKQQPEYVGAPQKRFAWAIGFVLALTMLYLTVIQHIMGPINLLVCATCLTLMFFESAFGICIGCKLYNVFNKEAAQLCPGGVCEVPASKVSRTRPAQWLILLAFAGLTISVAQILKNNPDMGAHGAPEGQHHTTNAISTSPDAEADRCKVPEFAKAMGHEDKWKLHNNCQ